jgi:peptidyl-prolyl cis-trans isomerase C
MKRMLMLPLLALALPLAGQQEAQTPASSAPGEKIVAVINGETITAARLDQLWNRIPPKTRDQYKNNGGKGAYLNNYIGKRLVVQEALKRGFDKKPEVMADVAVARETALFDWFVHDVVAPGIVADSAVRKFYDENPENFRVPEKIKVRHIVLTINPAAVNGKTKQDALNLAQQISLQLFPFFHGTDESEATKLARVRKFAELAAHYSDDGAAQQGGDLGWVDKGALDQQFEEAAFALPVGKLSGIVETKYGYHIILVEDKKPASLQPFDEVKDEIREYLLSQHQAELLNAMTRLTTELRTSGASKVAVFPENIE